MRAAWLRRSPRATGSFAADAYRGGNNDGTHKVEAPGQADEQIAPYPHAVWSSAFDRFLHALPELWQQHDPWQPREAWEVQLVWGRREGDEDHLVWEVLEKAPMKGARRRPHRLLA